MLISSSYLTPLQFSETPKTKLARSTPLSEKSAARLLFQHGVGSVTIPTWHRVRALSFGPTNFEQSLHLCEGYISISKYPQETRFYASHIHEFKNGFIKQTKIIIYDSHISCNRFQKLNTSRLKK